MRIALDGRHCRPPAIDVSIFVRLSTSRSQITGCSGVPPSSACTLTRTTVAHVMGYTAGRGWIEALRHDHPNHILGLRLNDWTSLIVFLAGATLFVHRRHQYLATPYRQAAPTPETISTA